MSLVARPTLQLQQSKRTSTRTIQSQPNCYYDLAVLPHIPSGKKQPRYVSSVLAIACTHCKGRAGQLELGKLLERKFSVTRQFHPKNISTNPAYDFKKVMQPMFQNETPIRCKESYVDFFSLALKNVRFPWDA